MNSHLNIFRHLRLIIFNCLAITIMAGFLPLNQSKATGVDCESYNPWLSLFFTMCTCENQQTCWYVCTGFIYIIQDCTESGEADECDDSFILIDYSDDPCQIVDIQTCCGGPGPGTICIPDPNPPNDVYILCRDFPCEFCSR